MNQTQAHAGYEIQVKGHLHHRWSPWLFDFEVSHLPDGSSRLSGRLPDGAALYALLSRLRDMGLILISLRQCDPPPASGPHPGAAGSA